jgi:hypothetical protein
MKPDLVQLAQRYVDLNSQLEEVRNAMRQALMNGGGSEAPPFAASQPMNRFTQARAKDEQLVQLLRSKPMRPAEITKAMSAKISTTNERLRRLKQKGLIEPCEGGWTATSPP